MAIGVVWAAEPPKRPPVEHDGGEVEEYVWNQDRQVERVAEWDLCNVVNPIPKRGVKQKHEAT